MKKIFFFIFTLAASITLQARTIYLSTGGSDLWNQGDAVFFVHTWNTTEDKADVQMQWLSGDIYQATISDNHANLLFVRMPNGSTEVNWDTYWNQTYDLTFENGKDMYVISGWVKDTKYSTGSWSTYNAEGGTDKEDGNKDGSDTGDKDYFLKGFCNGKDIETPTADEQFEHGMLTYTFTGNEPDTKGYFFILVCDKGQVIGKQYMASAYTEGGTSCVMVPDGAQTWGIQQGTVTFYLYKDEGDSYTLATAPIAGRKTVDAVDTADEQVVRELQNSMVFNLLGQPVDDNYKGIVIVNGRKQIRK